jgi:hypothetical protein
MKVNFTGIIDSIWTRKSRKADDVEYAACSWFAHFTDRSLYDYEYGVIITREQCEEWTITSWSEPFPCAYATVPIHRIDVNGDTRMGGETSHVLFLFDDLDVASMFRLSW